MAALTVLSRANACEGLPLGLFVHEDAYEYYGALSPQRSESPELIDLYTTHTSFDSRSFGSSFVVVTDESNVGDRVPRDLSLNRSLDHGDDTKTAEPQLLAINGGLRPGEGERGSDFQGRNMKANSVAFSFSSFTSETNPSGKSSKQDPTASASNSIFQDDTEFSPFVVDPPSDEVVDMSASTVLVERHISQKEGRMLKSNNKELRLKIKKLTEVLEQMRKESDKLRNEMESKSKDDDMKSAMILKEKELRRHIEELEDEHKLEVEKYKVELEECKVKLEKYKTELEKCEVELEEQRNRSQEAEERSQKKLVENEKVIFELQSAINTLQEQIMESKKDLEKSEKMVEDLLGKLQANDTKNVITETEISVLNEKIDHLMKEIAVLKKSKHHHHQEHHHHQLLDDKSQHNVHRVYEQSITRDPNRSEDVFSKPRKEPKPIEHDVHVAGSTSHGGDARKASESSLNSYPKPKPRQYYEHHDPPRASHVHKSQPKPRPVQALVAPRLPFVGHNLLPSVNDVEHLQPYHHHLAVTKQPPAAQAKPTPPLNDAQKLAATANWVHKLPEHDDRKQNSDKTVKEKQEDNEEYGVFNYPNRREKSDLSEERIDELSRSEGTVIKCPICFQVLHSREKYGIELHVERCLQQSEAGLRN